MVTGRLRVCWQRAVLALSLLAGTAAMPVLTGATEVYRWVDSEGIVHFADRPPAGRSVEQIEIQPPVGALPLPNAEEILRRPVRPQDQSDQSEERPEAPEPEAEAEAPEEHVRDRRSFRGR